MPQDRPSAFLSNFQQAFSFIDDIKSRERREVSLQERLAEDRAERAFQRKRQGQFDIEREEDRAFAATERDYLIEERRQAKTREIRQREGTALIADPNTSIAQLEEYADFANVAAEINRKSSALSRRER